MLVRPTIFVVLYFSVFLLTGCAHRFTGCFVFTNSSQTQVSASVNISDYWPLTDPVAIQPTNSWICDIRERPLRLPQQAVVTWTEAGSLETYTNISLSAMPMFPRRHGDIVFEFTPMHTWTVRYEYYK
jgi:hypothetical protein